MEETKQLNLENVNGDTVKSSPEVVAKELETKLDDVDFVTPYEGKPGTPVNIAGSIYILPPLTLPLLRKFAVSKLKIQTLKLKVKLDSIILNPDSLDEKNIELLEALQEEGEVIAEKLADALYVALQRNYPNVSKEDTIDQLTMSETMSLVSALETTPEVLDKLKN